MKAVLPWLIAAVGVLGLISQGAAADDAGFYRVAKLGDVWWFIRPDGKPFFASGVNVIDPGPPRAEYDPAQPAYAAFRHYPDTASWARKAQERLEQWGFNSVGGWSAPELTKGPFPYVEVLHIGGKLGAPFSDILHPNYARRLDAWIRQHVKPRANDRNLLGWCTDNEQSWFPDMLFWNHIKASPESNTRQALVRLLEDHYQHDFRKLEADFLPTAAHSFDALQQGGQLRLRPGGQGMKVANRFMALLAEHYYRTMHEAIRRYDPNHLILGDRYHGYCPDVVVEAARPFVDVLTTNYDRPDWTGGSLPHYYLRRLHELSDKPILVTEYYVAARENRSGNMNTGNVFTTVATQDDRAAAARNRLKFFASLPYVVGAHWFQYTDEPTHGRQKDGEDYNFGLVDIEDRPYEELAAAFADVHPEMPKIHSASGAKSATAEALPISIPTVSSQAFDGIGNWDAEKAIVHGGQKGPLHADLLASWNGEGLYLAVVRCHFVDEAAYCDANPPAGVRDLEWRITVDGRPWISQVEFGDGEEVSASNPACECRLWRHQIRYTVIAHLPVATFGRNQLQRGDRLTLSAELIDRRFGTKMTWERELQCGGSRRSATKAASRRRVEQQLKTCLARH